MANKKRGEISVNLGGRKRIMKLTLNDFAELQDRNNNQPLLTILSELDNLNLKLIRSILYLALRHDDPDLTEEQVGAFDMNLVQVTELIGQCVQASLGMEDSSGKKK